MIFILNVAGWVCRSATPDVLRRDHGSGPRFALPDQRVPTGTCAAPGIMSGMNVMIGGLR